MGLRETRVLYQKYLEDSASLSVLEKDCLIKGLAHIIQRCYENSTEPDKIFIYTESYKKLIDS